jgi:beta-RFAP synthase
LALEPASPGRFTAPCVPATAANAVVRVRTGSRLHFGLLAMHPDLPRRFGGAGLMVDEPGVELVLEPAPRRGAGASGCFEPTADDVTGPCAARVADFAGRFCAEVRSRDRAAVTPFRIRVGRAAPEHAGLGTGTQLGLATAAAIARHAGLDRLTVAELAARVGRGLRSAVGLHGFAHGGLLVEGGKRAGEAVSPLVARVAFPADWRIVLIIPRALRGLHGAPEEQAFAGLPAVPVATTQRLCAVALLQLLPAAVEGRLDEFGEALYELQQTVGASFKPAQGGVYADPSLAQMAAFLRGRGIRGVGQSSWGPAIYAVTAGRPDACAAADAVRRRFGLTADEVLITGALNRGAVVRRAAPARRRRAGGS